MVGQNFHDISLKRKDRVLPLITVNSAIKIHNEKIPVDPTVLFQRICIAKKSDEQLKGYMSYELAPYPLSIFNEGVFRKTDKSKLFDLFTTYDDILEQDDCVYIIDGGMLLHRVQWKKNDKFNDIFKSYVSYIKSHFKTDVIVVFDGYTYNSTSTKAVKRTRRSNKNSSPNIYFDEEMAVTVSQESFLSNQCNKTCFIEYLTTFLKKEKILVKQAPDDADLLIARTAIEQHCKTPVIIAEDVDVLVLLISLSPPAKKFIFRNPLEEK